MTILFTVTANTIECDPDFKCEVVNESESLILGQFRCKDWGTAFVKALRLASCYDEHEVFTEGIKLHGMNEDTGTEHECFVSAWGDCEGNHYFDLCISGSDGYVFRINKNYVNADNAFDIVWEDRDEQF